MSTEKLRNLELPCVALDGNWALMSSQVQQPQQLQWTNMQLVVLITRRCRRHCLYVEFMQRSTC